MLNKLIIYFAFFLRGFSFIVLLPFFTKFIDNHTWATVLSSQSISSWFIIIIDFGFALSLSRDIALQRNDLSFIKLQIGNVLSAKLFISICILLISLPMYHLSIFRENRSILLFGVLWSIAQGFSPIWYYQAVEELEKYCRVEIGFRLAYIIFSLIFVRSSNDAYLIMAFQFVSVMLINFVTMKFIITKFNGFSLSIHGAISALKKGIYLSMFNVVTSLYSSAGVFLLSILAPASQVAIYGNNERLVRAALNIFGPLNQIYLARSIKSYGEDVNKGINFAKKIGRIYLLIGLTLYIGIFILSGFISNILNPTVVKQASIYLNIIAIIIPLVAINTVLNYHVLVPLKQDKYILVIYTVSSVIALISILILVKNYAGYGMVVSAIIPEIVALILIVARLNFVFRRIKNAT